MCSKRVIRHFNIEYAMHQDSDEGDTNMHKVPFGEFGRCLRSYLRRQPSVSRDSTAFRFPTHLSSILRIPESMVVVDLRSYIFLVLFVIYVDSLSLSEGRSEPRLRSSSRFNVYKSQII